MRYGEHNQMTEKPAKAQLERELRVLKFSGFVVYKKFKQIFKKWHGCYHGPFLRRNFFGGQTLRHEHITRATEFEYNQPSKINTKRLKVKRDSYPVFH